MAIEVGAPGMIMPPVEGLLRGARRAEEKGYDAIWWPDHLMGWFPESIWTPDITPIAAFQPSPHVYLDPLVAMSAAAVHTERIRLGTSVTEPIRRNPASLAQSWLSLDHLSRGRAILGIGSGERENVTPYGLSFERTVSRFEEALRIVRMLWSSRGEPVDFDGEHWTLRGAVLGLEPFEGRTPPIWTGARGPRMLGITGRLADGWLPPFMLPGAWSDALGRIRDAARAAGRDPDAITPALWSYAVVAEDHETCHRLLDTPIQRSNMLVLPSRTFAERGHAHPFGEGFDGLADYIPSELSRDDALKAIDAVPFEIVHDHTLHGTPDDLVAKVRAYEGLRHVVLWNITFLSDASLVRPSFALMDDVRAALAG